MYLRIIYAGYFTISSKQKIYFSCQCYNIRAGLFEYTCELQTHEMAAKRRVGGGKNKNYSLTMRIIHGAKNEKENRIESDLQNQNKHADLHM